MTTIPQSLSPTNQITQTNALTNLSIKAGNLDHNAYKEYLKTVGHVKTGHNAMSVRAPIFPQNSVLQNNDGDRLDDLTDFRADQALWSQDNLPDVIYIFSKPRYWLEVKHLNPAPLKTYDIYGKRLRDVPVLPDHISSNVEGWRIEAWMRFDPRMKLADIMDRISPETRPSNKSVIQMRTLRFRTDCNVLGWVALGKNYETRKQHIIQEMVKHGIDPSNNSTRGLSWGLKSEVLGEAGGRIMVPEGRRLENTVDMTGVAAEIYQSAAATEASTSPSSTPTSEASTIILLPEDWQYDDEDEDEYEEEEEDIDEGQKRKRCEDIFNAGNNRKHEDLHPNRALLPSINLDTLFPHSTSQSSSPTPICLSTPNLCLDDPRPQQNPQPEPATTIIHLGRPLTLKTPLERLYDAPSIAVLQREWHPVRSERRRLQLAYLLDPARLANRRGFIDNRGYWPPVDGDTACIDADIIYG